MKYTIRERPPCPIGDQLLQNSKTIEDICIRKLTDKISESPWFHGHVHKELTEADRKRRAAEELERQRILEERESKVKPVHREIAEQLGECVSGWGDQEWDKDEASRILAERFPA